MIRLNKKLISDNIKHLLEIRNIKISSFEEELGISSGYITCIGNEKRKSEPTLSIIYNIALMLDVNIDLLINYDLSNAKFADLELLDFVEKLDNYTLSGEMKWAETEIEKFVKLVHNMEPYNKLFKRGLFNYISVNNYSSLFENFTSISSPLLISNFKGSEILLIPVKTRGKLSYELYIKEKNELCPMCHGVIEENVLYEKMDGLYMHGLNNIRSNKINDNKRKLLNKF